VELSVLSLQSNFLIGDVASLDGLMRLTSLRVLDVGENKLGGIFPVVWPYEDTRVTELYLDENEIGGSIST